MEADVPQSQYARKYQGTSISLCRKWVNNWKLFNKENSKLGLGLYLYLIESDTIDRHYITIAKILKIGIEAELFTFYDIFNCDTEKIEWFESVRKSFDKIKKLDKI